MKDKNRGKEQLMVEIDQLLKKNAKLEKIRAQQKQTEFALENIEWLLTKNIPDSIKPEPQPYGNLVDLNTNRTIADSVGAEVLEDIASDYLNLLESSGAIYEKNGDYALGIFSSGWCRFLDNASYKLCETKDNAEALKSGKWLCHESCWTDASKVAIETGGPVDIECNGGIRLYAIPILVEGKIAGCINFGYGDPPAEENKLKEIAEKYVVDVDELRNLAHAYKSRPAYFIELAKKRLHLSAKLIGEITERKMAEQALRANEEKYRMLNEHTPMPHQSLNMDGGIKDVNPAWLSTLGYTRNEVFGKYFGDFLHPDDRESFKHNFPAFLKRGYVHDVSYQIRHRHGHYLEISFEGRIGYYPDGSFRQTYCVFQDITERRRAEKALKVSEEQFRAIFEQAGVGVARIVSDTGKFIRVNQRYADILGYTLEEVEKLTFQEITYPDDLAEDLKNMRAMLSGETLGFSMEKRYLHKNGKTVWVKLTVSPMRQIGREEKHHIAVVEDITEAKAAAKALKESEARYRTLFNYAPDGILIADTKSKYIDANPVICRMLGYDREELIGLHANDIVAEAESVHIEPALEMIIKQGTYSREWRFRRKDGSSFDAEVNLTQMPDGNLLASIRDISQRKAAEAALRASEERFKFLFEQAAVPIWLEDFSEIKKHFDQLKSDGVSNFEAYYADNPEEVGKMAALVKVIDVNQKSVEFYGAADKESLVTELPIYFTTESEEVFRRELVALANGADRFESEISLVTPAGNQIFLIVSLSVPEIYHNTLERVMVSFLDITERKRAAEALKKSEESYRQMFRSNPFPMWVYDLETLAFLSVNDAALRHYGYSRAEFFAMTIKDIRPPEDVPALLENVALVSGGLDEAGVWRHKKKDGAIIDVEITSHTLLWGGRSAELVMVDDVTERIRAERALRESEKFNRRIAEVLPSVLYIFDLRTWNNLFINREVGATLGYSPEEIAAKGANFIPDTMHPDDLPKFDAHLKNVFNLPDGETLDLEYRMKAASGEWRWYVSRDSIFERDEEGIPTKLLGIATDITNSKQAEETALASEAQLRIIFDSSIDLQALVKIESADVFKIAAINERYLQTLVEVGYNLSKRDIIGKTIPELLLDLFGLNQRAVDFTLKKYHEVVKTKKPQRYEESFQFETGPLHAEVSMNPILDKTGRCSHILFISHNITDRKLAEIALRESQTELLRAQEIGKVGSWTLDLRESKFVVSEEFARIHGMGETEFHFDDLRKLLHPDDVEEVVRVLEEVLAGIADYRLEHRILREDNAELRWVAAKGEVILDDDGAPFKIFGTTQDITERKLIQLKISEQLDELKRWHEVSLNREDRIQELKREVNELLLGQNMPPRYQSQEKN